MNQNQQISGKALVLGDSGLGKTTILLRFSENKFDPSYLSTIGVDLKAKCVKVDNYEVKLRLYDTASQERFHSITSKFYKDADGIILCYDITNRESFDRIKY